VVALSLFLLAASRGDEKHQSQSRRDNRTSEKESKQPTSAFTIVVQPAPVKVIQQAPPIEKNQAPQKWYERPTITDWGIFGVTIAYTLISLGLLDATRRQARLANGVLVETRKAADAAIRSAQAAQVTAQTLIHIEWPRLLFERFDPIDPIPDAPPRDWPNIIIGFRNYGRTTAFVTEIFITGQIASWLEPDPTYWSPVPMRPIFPIAPNERFTHSILVGTRTLRREDLDAILQGKTNYWVFGYISYLDVRHDTHMTGFCARWRIDPNVWSHDGPPNYTYHTYTEGH
jgi:hypothetical protein